MINTDLHIHSCFCDGVDLPETIVLEAIKKGIKHLGIVVHSFVPFDKDFCLEENRYQEFIAEISKLKSKYKDKITLYAGIELDYYSTPNVSGFDYVIGAVHYIEKNGEYYSVDLSPEELKRAVEVGFFGNYMEFAKEYYLLVSKLCERPCDIIAHFDLITKYNDKYKLFDTESNEYKNAWQQSANELLKHNKYFEINTGAMFRVGKKEPYPSTEIINYLKERGAKFILSSDAHSKSAIAYNFEDYEK
ncbi:MAG: histidinol-phosphatase HisJ family protein [Clostridia bacterium]|nr:histidinol-phosphatase HisJ family protein [Clostridia bacterium]